MGTPLYGSSVRDLVSAAKRAALVAVVLVSLSAWGEDKGPVTPSPEFLALPSFDVAIPTQKDPFRVGDEIDLKVQGMPPSSESTFDTSRDGEDLEEQGWELVTPPKEPATVTVTALKPGKLTLPSLAIKD